MTGEQNWGWRVRDDAFQPCLASQERPAAQIPAIQPQQVEGVEVGTVTPEEKGVKNATAVIPQTADLPIDDRVPGLDGLGDISQNARNPLNSRPLRLTSLHLPPSM